MITDTGFDLNWDRYYPSLSRDLPQVRDRLRAQNLATYLSDAPLSELIDLVSALSAELGTVRGIQVAEPLGLVAARLEYCDEAGR